METVAPVLGDDDVGVVRRGEAWSVRNSTEVILSRGSPALGKLLQLSAVIYKTPWDVAIEGR